MKKFISIAILSVMLVLAVTCNVSAATEFDSDMSASDNTAVIRMETPLKMAVRFENGNVYYGGEMVKIDIDRDYNFQMCSVNWENGLFDGVDNGICGTVVYSMKALEKDDFRSLRATALEDSARYTVKGDDIIDNTEKKIYVNSAAEDFHLETDVNNFFMAYRFSFSKGSFNKKTRINGVVNTAKESLSVNLPVGSVIDCEAVVNGKTQKTASILIENNSGEGIYSSEYLTSVNDYVWDVTGSSESSSEETTPAEETPVYYDSTWSMDEKLKGYAKAMNAILTEIGKNYDPAPYGYLFGSRFGEYGDKVPYCPEGSTTPVSGAMYSIQLCDLDNMFYMVAEDGTMDTGKMSDYLTAKGLDVAELRSETGIAKYSPYVLVDEDGNYVALTCNVIGDNKHGLVLYPDGKIVELHHTNENASWLDNISWNDFAYYGSHEAEAISTFGTK